MAGSAEHSLHVSRGGGASRSSSSLRPWPRLPLTNETVVEESSRSAVKLFGIFVAVASSCAAATLCSPAQRPRSGSQAGTARSGVWPGNSPHRLRDLPRGEEGKTGRCQFWLPSFPLRCPSQESSATPAVDGQTPLPRFRGPILSSRRERPDRNGPSAPGGDVGGTEG